MRHCCEFDAYDIWYLKDNENFTNRTLFIGDCPRCQKHVVVLMQKNAKTNTFMTIKKVGETALKFSHNLISDIIYSRNNVNMMKFKSKPYNWRYGVNKEKKDKDGNIILEQYAKDFYGNSELVKRKDR